MVYLNQKQQKIVKWIAYAIQVILIVLVIVFGSVATKRGKTIKNYQAMHKQEMELVDSLLWANKALGAEEVISVTCQFNINQKNVLSFSQTNAQNIAKEVAKMTRQELYDSLYAKKYAENGDIQQK